MSFPLFPHSRLSSAWIDIATLLSAIRERADGYGLVTELSFVSPCLRLAAEDRNGTEKFEEKSRNLGLVMVPGRHLVKVELVRPRSL